MNALLALALLAATYAPATSVVYSRYPNGKPRLVVKTKTDPDEVLLVRMPGNVILDRQPLDDRAVEVTLQRLIDPQDVVVEMFAPHTPGANLYRVRGNKLVFIGLASVYWGLIAADLDHDGVPEIITTGCCHPTKCGVMIGSGVMRFNGKEYVDDEVDYINYTAASETTRTEEFAVEEEGPYVVHVYHDRGVTARVTIDDEPVADGQRVELEKDCHALVIAPKGRKDAVVHVFIEKP